MSVQHDNEFEKKKIECLRVSSIHILSLLSINAIVVIYFDLWNATKRLQKYNNIFFN